MKTTDVLNNQARWRLLFVTAAGIGSIPVLVLSGTADEGLALSVLAFASFGLGGFGHARWPSIATAVGVLQVVLAGLWLASESGYLLVLGLCVSTMMICAHLFRLADGAAPVANHRC